MEAYLDNAATTRVFPEVREMMDRVMEEDFGNPSSKHSRGIAAEQYIKDAKDKISRILKCQPKELIFTSGGTEANNLAFIGTSIANRREGKHLITTRIEHASVHEPLGYLEELGYEVTYLQVKRDGRVALETVAQALREDTFLVSIMYVNNEVGSVQPIGEIGRLLRERNPRILFHVDAIQAFGKMKIHPAKLGVDMLSASAHKIHGPKGVGALYVRKGVTIPAFINGGGQEKHRRSGTENVPGIMGFGMASQIAEKHFDQRVSAMAAARRRLFDGLCDQISDIRVNSPEDGAASVLNVSFLGCRGEVLLHTLEQDQIYVSTGSACSSNKKGRSHVLAAMGLSDKEIEGAIRFSFNEFNT